MLPEDLPLYLVSTKLHTRNQLSSSYILPSVGSSVTSQIEYIRLMIICLSTAFKSAALLQT